MRFAIKLVAALWIGLVIIYGVAAFERYRREAALFEEDMRRDHEVMGRGIAGAIGEIWEDEGKHRALELVERVNQKENDITIRWVDAAPDAAPELRPNAPVSMLGPLDRGSSVNWVDLDEVRLVTYVPLHVGDHRVGAIELTESLLGERAYVNANLFRLGITSGALALFSGVISVVLGVRFIGRPIRRLVEKARRVGSGDFTGPLDLQQADELGELAVEMNAMSDRLAEARARVEAESTARAAANEQLRHAERLMTVGTLASGVAHELGTPLNVIGQRAKMIATGEVAGADVLEYARIVADQAGRITDIVRQLLDFARRRQPEMAVQDIPALAQRTVRLVDPIARRYGVGITVGASPSTLAAAVDPVQMQQVLTNLVMNGVQAMPNGGSLRVDIFRSTMSRPADVGSPPAGGSWVAVRVEDEGAGIPPENLPKVFDPFFTTKGVGEGTGLGLSVAYGIVKEHGGWIDVESRPGEGAAFTAYLPEVSS